MGLLVDGTWQDRSFDAQASGGQFRRQVQYFRNWITPDGEAGPSGTAGFKAAPDRYHLYVSLACPWAHRTLIFRSLKGLEDVIPISVVHWFAGENGWTFNPVMASSATRWAALGTCTKSINARNRTLRGALPCPHCGIERPGQSSTTSRPKSFEC